MNILFYTGRSPFANSVLGGAETSMELLAEQLQGRGHRITWLTRSSATLALPKIQPAENYGISIELFRPTRGSGHLKALNLWNNLFFRKYLTGILHKHEIEIVYCYYDDLRFFKEILRLKKNGLKIKIVMRMAGLRWYEQCLKERSLIKKYQIVFNNVDCVNFIHRGLEKIVSDCLMKLGMKVKFKNSLAGDIGSSARVGRKKSYKALNNPRFTTVMAARFSNYQKRQDILVKAVSLIDSNMPLKLTLIGEGPERDKISCMISQLNLQDRVEIESFKEQRALWNDLENADLLCHACDYEGLGKTIIEAMAVGLPVLVSNVAPLNEYIEDGKTGFLADNTAQDWAMKIKSLYYNKEALVRVSNSEMNFVKENYDAGKNVILYENCFSSLIENGNE